MEAVALDAGRGVRAWQRDGPGDRWLGGVERGVEARHLRQIGIARGQGADRHQVDGLVQRRQRHQALERREHLVGDPHGLGEPLAAVDDPVSDPGERGPREVPVNPGADRCDRALVVRRLAGLAVTLDQRCSSGHADVQTRAHPDAFQLAVRLGGEVVRARVVQRELDARRAGVDDEDATGHTAAPRVRQWQ